MRCGGCAWAGRCRIPGELGIVERNDRQVWTCRSGGSCGACPGLLFAVRGSEWCVVRGLVFGFFVFLIVVFVFVVVLVLVLFFGPFFA